MSNTEFTGQSAPAETAGKRGLRLRYFFYFFYPGHLIVLGLIRHLGLMKR